MYVVATRTPFLNKSQAHRRTGHVIKLRVFALAKYKIMTQLRVFIDHNDFTNCMSSVSYFERPVTSIAYVWHTVNNRILKSLTHPF